MIEKNGYNIPLELLVKGTLTTVCFRVIVAGGFLLSGLFCPDYNFMIKRKLPEFVNEK